MIMTETYRDIAVESRVRLSRNLGNYPFPARLGAKRAEEIVEKLKSKAENAGLAVRVFRDQDKDELRALAEEEIGSADFTASKLPRALFTGENVSVMVNENDHVRIQAVSAGLSLEESYEKAKEMDEKLLGDETIAFDERLGYVTSSPTGLGTALRASVTLHLPALGESGQIDRVMLDADRLGVTIRGFLGEGSSAVGGLYTVTNRTTLGVSEEEILKRIGEVAEKLIEKERELRAKGLAQNEIRLTDRVRRAAAILKNAYVIGYNEAMLLLSDYRMGVSLGLVEGDYAKMNDLIRAVQPAVVWNGCEDKSELARDRRRAEIVTAALA